MSGASSLFYAGEQTDLTLGAPPASLLAIYYMKFFTVLEGVLPFVHCKLLEQNISGVHPSSPPLLMADRLALHLAILGAGALYAEDRAFGDIMLDKSRKTALHEVRITHNRRHYLSDKG